MSRPFRILALIVLAGTAVGCDQASKSLARSVLVETGPLELAGGAVQLGLVTNRGGFLGLGSGLESSIRWWAFTFAVALMLAGMAVVSVVGDQTTTRFLGLALVVGGGAGNLLDRVLLSGEVVDFIVLQAGPLRTGVFNLADVAILLGLGLAVSCGSRSRRSRRRLVSPGPPQVDTGRADVEAE